MRIWDRFLTPRDRKVVAASGTNTTLGFGARAALLVVDVTYGFTGPRSQSLLSAIARFPDACGPDAWLAVDRIRPLIDHSRAVGSPVFYTKPFPPRQDRIGALEWRNPPREPRDHANGIDPAAIVDEISPTGSDYVIEKIAPSAFFGTSLMTVLTRAGFDTVVVCGGTTSGCVRATVIDAFSYGLRVIVAEDATFDRGEASHALGLFDIDAKYADVLTIEQIVRERWC